MAGEQATGLYGRARRKRDRQALSDAQLQQAHDYCFQKKDWDTMASIEMEQADRKDRT